MGFFEISKDLLNKTLTENGDLAYATSGSACVDYFALIGGKRYDLKNAAILFVRALSEDLETAAKLLFYTRDPRGGIGERRLFRFLFNSFASSYPKMAEPLLPFIAKYGRYDDLFCVFGTALEDDAVSIIEAQLEEDLAAKKEGKPVSLLAKWLPSINTSSDEARALALRLSKKLGMSSAEYRKTLSYLRKGLIVENNLRAKEYDFDYAKVPSLAMAKYAEAFRRNDAERFSAYVEAVNKGEVKMNVAVGDPVQLVRAYRAKFVEKDFDPSYYETAWRAFVEEGEVKKKTLVVRDGSGSMYWAATNPAPIEIADAMSLLTAARLKGAFHDRFITFSANPEVVDLSDLDALGDKLFALKKHDDCENTNIEKVYNLILDVYKSPSFKPEDAIDQVLIISDMEFDQGVDGFKASTFETFKTRFEKLGYPRPEIVFWNVNARGIHLPVMMNEQGVKLVSGNSKEIINMVSATDSLDPKDFMVKALAKYQEVAAALPKEE